jgi:3-oxoacyl-[acyl-carrier-protein] synthase-3
MAVLAARPALAMAGLTGRELGVVAHSWTFHQGYDAWSPAHYIADQLGVTRRAFPFGVQQACNGSAAGLQLAAQMLLADPAAGPAMISAADRFVGPIWDRWTANPAVPCGDGAAAAVLRPAAPGDVLRLRSIAQASAAELWVTRQQPGGFTDGPTWQLGIDNRPDPRFYAAGGYEVFRSAAAEATMTAFTTALQDAELDADDPRIRCVALPRLGPRVRELMYGESLAALFPGRELLLGERTGHLGSGDLLANMHDLACGGWLVPGDIAVLASGGGGYSWSCAIVEVPAALGGRG